MGEILNPSREVVKTRKILKVQENLFIEWLHQSKYSVHVHDIRLIEFMYSVLVASHTAVSLCRF